MVPVRANGQPAWGEYVRDPVTGGLHVTGILVAGLAGDRICELTHFETTLTPYFGLPRTLDDPGAAGSATASAPPAGAE